MFDPILMVFGLISYVIVLISLIMSVKEFKKLKNGFFYNYLLLVNLAFGFIVTPYTIWMVKEIFVSDVFVSNVINVFIFVLMSVASFIFLKSAILIKNKFKDY